LRVPRASLLLSSVHHRNTGKKVDEFGGMSSDRVPVFSCCRLL